MCSLEKELFALCLLEASNVLFETLSDFARYIMPLRVQVSHYFLASKFVRLLVLQKSNEPLVCFLAHLLTFTFRALRAHLPDDRAIGFPSFLLVGVSL